MTLRPPNPLSVQWSDVSIFIPYTKFYPTTILALIGFNYQPVKMEGEYGYANFFQERWQEGKPFIVIEQDVVVWPGAIRAIWDCPREWCAYDFHLPNHQTRNLEQEQNGVPLGCAKFLVEAIRKTATLWETPVAWSYCDQTMTKGLLQAGVQAHQHRPGVVNANEALLGYLGGVENEL